VKDKTYDGLALAQKIRAAGRSIFIAEDDGAAPSIPCDGLRVRQTGGVMESQAIDSSGGTAFILNLGITINLPKFAISAFGLEPPWKNDSFYWLEDPLEIDGTSRCYRFGSKDLPEFERGIINHCANVRHVFSSGESLKGLLLGYEFDSIPEEFRHGMMIPAFVMIYDQFGREHRSPVELQVVRNHTRPRALRKSSLLDRPDSTAGRKA
jgi:hypothetical protein